MSVFVSDRLDTTGGRVGSRPCDMILIDKSLLGDGVGG